MKTALITGASGGLGYEFAHLLARKGYSLVLVARSEGKLYQLKKELQKKYAKKLEITVIAKDLSEKDAALEIFEEVLEKGIEVNMLINNAGFGDFGRFAECDWEKQYEMVQVNIVAMMQMTKYFMKPMMERGQGHILNMASTAAFQPGPFFSSYFASKAFVLSFTEAIAKELEGSGVHAMALCPGPTRTGFEEKAEAESSKLFKTFKMATAKNVVEFGYRKLMKNRVVAVHGFRNTMLTIGIKVTPRFLVRDIMYKLQGYQKKI
ncbi:SDR family NAD(P)-dependent oxidoreductase [Konateibacter massiliensis]|uniref:SDR family NAD(P)-dependent oxidoreductase n=1 Tax=Konateibacter massiliensis TaxID=2002841 RepID=UPI000C15D59B|nr:SDR family oxidoreductase [Konateibacter massiliensis]